MGTRTEDLATPLAVSPAVSDIPVAYCVLPPVRAELIDRDRVVKRILDAGTPVVEIVAPPGFGKSTAIRLCAEADRRPYAWVQLSEADDDPVHLGRHIALALDRIAPLADDDVASIVGAGRSAEHDVFPTLVDLLADRSPCVLVLDDVHLLTGDGSAASLKGLLQALAPGATVALVGRRDPVALGRQRMGGRVHTVTADDLAMGVLEATELFQRAGVHVDDDELRDLVERTEGWPGGLHLATLALAQGRSSDAFSGRDRLMGEYLVEEVLSGFDPELVAFMEGSAVLDTMDADELDELLGRRDSARILGSIEADGNLLLIPLDHESKRFRYHHLLRDHLRQRLGSDDPERAGRLERRASELRERAGDVDQAVRHAVRAGDRERAAGLILSVALARWFDGRVVLLGEWLALLGHDAIEQYPEAALAAAWFAIASGDRPAAVRAGEAAAAFGDRGPLADGSPTAEVALAAARMIMAEAGVDSVIDDAELVRGAGGPDSNPWWALATGTQGSAYAMIGELDLARERLEEAVAAGAGAPYIDAVGQAQLAMLDLYEGRTDEAEQRIGAARVVADDHHLDRFPPAVSVYAIDALISAQTRRAEHARQAAAIAGVIAGRLGGISPRTLLFTEVLLAQAAHALGDLVEARRLVAEAGRTQRRDRTATFLNTQLDELVLRLASFRDGDAAGPEGLTSAEGRVLAHLPTHLPLGMIAAELHLSRNTVKTHTTAIYRKLGVSSRTEAVTAARAVGLLPPA